MERLRRDRAAAQALRVAFPAVQHLRLELKFESTTSSTPTLQSHVLHPPARAFFEFPCPYADCDGQFDLTSAVKAALADPAHQAAGVLECAGLRVRDYASKRPCCAEVMRSPHPPHEPPPVYSPRRRHNSPCGRSRCLSRQRMASVAAAWSMRGSSLARGRQSSSGWLTLRLPPGERNAQSEWERWRRSRKTCNLAPGS